VTDYSPAFVRTALDEMGIALHDDTEYAEVALRLSTVVEAVLYLMSEIPDNSDALMPHELMQADDPRRSS